MKWSNILEEVVVLGLTLLAFAVVAVVMIDIIKLLTRLFE